VSKATEVIREHHDEIIRLWLENAGRLLSAEGLAPLEIVSNLPDLLRSLGSVAAEDAPGQFAGSARKLIDGHLSARLRQGFDIEDVVAELSLLGRCIVEAWGHAHPQEPPRGEDVQRIYSQLSGASVAATELFRSHMMLEEQCEKRVMRQMSAIAEDALQNQHVLHARLDELLALVMRAMGAQSASLVVFNAHDARAPSRRGDVVASAVLGAGCDALARFALDPSALAPDPSHGVARAEATEMHVGEELWARGVRSLLALRATRHSLGTVMYIGMERAHAFSSRETRRIEALGEWLTVLLDNAALHARLSERVTALHDETELRDRLVALIAHDLRGPLSAAKMCAELLARKGRRAREKGCDASDELASKIVRLLLKCDGMVGNLLDANRLHAGEALQLELAPCDLHAICDDVIEELSPLLGDRVTVSLSSVVGNWSAAELHRAVWNLINNALQHGDKGSTITITTTATDDGAAVSVHNFGSPIDPCDLENIFRPFARHGHQGWGVGLALVKGCADAHGGDVSVSSDAHGTTFTLRLPRDTAAVRGAQSAQRRATPALTTRDEHVMRSEGAPPVHAAHDEPDAHLH
jgi:signal transduction histidine kinase